MPSRWSASPSGPPGSTVSTSSPSRERIWAGYAFAVDYRQARGHAYALTDQTYTGRQRVVSMADGFHGRTLGALGATGSASYDHPTYCTPRIRVSV